jgi:hypothetical protein
VVHFPCAYRFIHSTPYLLLIICSVLPDVRCKLISAVVAHELLEVI